MEILSISSSVISSSYSNSCMSISVINTRGPAEQTKRSCISVEDSNIVSMFIRLLSINLSHQSVTSSFAEIFTISGLVSSQRRPLWNPSFILFRSDNCIRHLNGRTSENYSVNNTYIARANTALPIFFPNYWNHEVPNGILDFNRSNFQFKIMYETSTLLNNQTGKPSTPRPSTPTTPRPSTPRQINFHYTID